MRRRCPACSERVTFATRFCAVCGASQLALRAPVPQLQSSGAAHRRFTMLGRAVLALAVVTVSVIGAIVGLPSDEPARSPLDDGAAPIEGLLWSSAIGTLGDRPVPRDLVATQGVTVVSTDESLWAFDAEHGNYLWGRRNERARLAPTLGEPEQIVATVRREDDSDAQIVAIGPADGLTIWSRPLGTAEHVVAAPGAVLLVGPEGLGVLDASDGGTRWRSTLVGRVSDADGNAVLLVSPEGDRIDALAMDDGRARWSATLDSSAGAQPQARFGLRTVVVAASDGTLRGLDPESGQTRWTRTGIGDPESLVVIDDVAIVRNDRRELVAHRSRTGALLWRDDRLLPVPTTYGAREHVAVVSGTYEVASLRSRDGQMMWSERLEPVREVTTSGETLLTADNLGHVTGIDLRDGHVRYRVTLPNEQSLGIVSDGQGVFAASSAGTISGLSAEGDVLWRLRVNAAHPVLSSDRLVVRHRTMEREGFNRSMQSRVGLLAIDTSTGEIVWDVDGLERSLPGSGMAADDDLVVELTDEAVRAHDATDGGERWTYHNPELIAVPPALTDDLVVIATRSGSVIGMDRDVGEPRWTSTLDATITTVPTVAGADVLVVAGDASVHLLDGQTGESRWDWRGAAPILYAPVVEGGTVVVVERELVGLDLASGALVWRRPLAAPPAGVPSVADGLLFVAATDGTVTSHSSSDGSPRAHLLAPAPIALGPVSGGDLHFVVDIYGAVHRIGPRRSLPPGVEPPPIRQRR